MMIKIPFYRVNIFDSLNAKNLKLKFAGDCENHHIFVDVIVKAVTESREST